MPAVPVNHSRVPLTLSYCIECAPVRGAVPIDQQGRCYYHWELALYLQDLEVFADYKATL
jgi:hypothetical protein